LRMASAVVSGDVAKAEAILKDDERALIERDSAGTPLLVLAVKQGNPAMVEMLIRSGADVDTKDREGQTPLAVALERKNNDVAELLGKAGAKGP